MIKDDDSTFEKCPHCKAEYFHGSPAIIEDDVPAVITGPAIIVGKSGFSFASLRPNPNEHSHAE